MAYADGTLEVDDAFEDGYFETCAQECIRSRPSAEALLEVFEGMCVDIVARVRANNPSIDSRCDNTENDVCELLCERRRHAARCHDDCVAECQDWDVSNRRCIDNTPRDECGRMNGCFAIRLVRRAADRFVTTCKVVYWKHAHPKLFLQPTGRLHGCRLPEPPSVRLTEEYVNYSCRDIDKVFTKIIQVAPYAMGVKIFDPARMNASTCARPV